MNRRKFIAISTLSLVGVGLSVCTTKTKLKNKQMKSVGLIGGTSWHSTIEYYRYINEGVNAILGEKTNPPLVIYNLNQQEIHDLQEQNNWNKIAELYVQVAKKLINAGVDALAFCANTPHKVYEKVSNQLSVPFIHIADGIGKEAQSKNYTKLGLIGTKFTMNENFIKSRLKNKYAIEVKVPNHEQIEKLHQIVIDELTHGKLYKESRAYTIHVLKELAGNEQLDGIILGCTELPLLINQQDFYLPLFNSTELHAQEIVKYILNE